MVHRAGTGTLSRGAGPRRKADGARAQPSTLARDVMPSRRHRGVRNAPSGEAVDEDEEFSHQGCPLRTSAPGTTRPMRPRYPFVRIREEFHAIRGEGAPASSRLQQAGVRSQRSPNFNAQDTWRGGSPPLQYLWTLYHNMYFKHHAILKRILNLLLSQSLCIPNGLIDSNQA